MSRSTSSAYSLRRSSRSRADSTSSARLRLPRLHLLVEEGDEAVVDARGPEDEVEEDEDQDEEDEDDDEDDEAEARPGPA